jgi:hypothetical protein
MTASVHIPAVRCDAANLTVGLCHPDGWIWLAVDGEVPAAACVIVASTVTVALAWA